MAIAHLTLNALLHHRGLVQDFTESLLGCTKNFVADADAFLGPRAMLVAERSGSLGGAGGGDVPRAAIHGVKGVGSASAVRTGLVVEAEVGARLGVANVAATSAAKRIACVVSRVCQTSSRLALDIALALVLCCARDIGHYTGARRGTALKLIALSMSFRTRNVSRNAFASGIRLVGLAWEGSLASRSLGTMEGSSPSRLRLEVSSLIG